MSALKNSEATEDLPDEIEGYARILSLFLPRCPTTIAEFIVAVIVLAVDRMGGGWEGAHIGIEVFELLPAFANPNAAATIIFILRGGWIPTARKHIAPNFIDRSLAQAMRNGGLPPIAPA
jgi:hypothetical protein